MRLRSGRNIIYKDKDCSKNKKMGNIKSRVRRAAAATTSDANLTVEIDVSESNPFLDQNQPQIERENTMCRPIFNAIATLSSSLGIIGGLYSIYMLYKQFFEEDDILRDGEIIEVMLMKK